jgi:hypothetical protein
VFGTTSSMSLSAPGEARVAVPFARLGRPWPTGAYDDVQGVVHRFCHRLEGGQDRVIGMREQEGWSLQQLMRESQVKPDRHTWPQRRPGGRLGADHGQQGHLKLIDPGTLDHLNRTVSVPLPEAESMLILHLRPSRVKARELAVAEVVALLRDLGARAAPGGPLSEMRGVAWVTLRKPSTDVIARRLAKLGYSGAVDIVQPTELAASPEARIVRWKRQDVALVRVFEESDAALRLSAPDRRTFLLECGDGVVRPIVGYRGGRGPLEHRALPVEDARVLVNLVALASRGRLLDPFAGAGGVVIEGCAAGWTVVSVDIDATLKYGLRELSCHHVVGDAVALPIADESIDAVATEPPHHPSAREVVKASLREISRILRPGGRAALLIASHQADAVRRAATETSLQLELDVQVDRKGTDVSCMCWLRL